jgi:outer membrane lipoprotein-sorting protein
VTLLIIGLGIFCFAARAEEMSGDRDLLQEGNDLPSILARCAAYCSKVRSSALNFVCEEKIFEKTFQDRPRMVSSKAQDEVTYFTAKTGQNRFLYDYQLVKKGTTLGEKKTLLEFNGKKADPQNASIKPRRFQSSNPLFGPVGFFDENWHDLYEYELKRKTDRLLDREAYVIKVTPKISIENKPNYGILWVDTEDYSILKFEVEGSSLAGFEQVLAEAKHQNLKPVFVTVHEYAISKNGVRFPSRTSFSEKYERLDDSSSVSLRSRTEIIYDHYRFFTVETEEEIKK